MPRIDMDSLSFIYPHGRRVLNGLSLSLPDGIVSLMGPSGCGKSTILRLIAGLEEPISGGIAVHSDRSIQKRGAIRYAVQNFDAFPWFTVRQNLQVWQSTQVIDGKAIDDALRAVGLDGVAHSYPHSLSGGMSKRLALARCILGNPIVILLDEVFSSLDIPLKKELYDLLLMARDRTGASIINVTHDVREAAYLSDQVVIMGHPPQSQAILMNIERSGHNKAQFLQTADFQQTEAEIYSSLEAPKESARPTSIIQ